MNNFDRKKDNGRKDLDIRNNSFDLEDLTRCLDIDNIEMISSLGLDSLDNEAALDAAIKSFAKRQVDVMFVFDRSGSCAGTENEMMRGFNSFIEHEKNERNEDFITLSLFDDKNEVIYDRTPVNKVKGFEYQVCGSTAFYDSLVKNLNNLRNKKNDNTEAIVVIMTDGVDNASCMYNIQDTREIISSLQEEGWHFIFLGAMDYTKDYAALLGIDEEYSEIYSPEAVEANFEAIKNVVDDVHKKGKVSEDWAEPILDARYQIEGGNGKVKKIEKRK